MEVKQNDLDFLAILFNKEDNRLKKSENSKENISFDVIIGDWINRYEATALESVKLDDIKRGIIDSSAKATITKKVDIYEDVNVYDLNLLFKLIEVAFGARQDNMYMNSIQLHERKRNISTYMVEAVVYPDVVRAIKGEFSLENLYFAYAAASDEDKKLIIDYIKALEFKKTKTINYKRIDSNISNEYIEFMNMANNTGKRAIEVLDAATKNITLLRMFNMDGAFTEVNDDFNFTVAGNSYIDDKVKKEKEKSQV